MHDPSLLWSLFSLVLKLVLSLYSLFFIICTCPTEITITNMTCKPVRVRRMQNLNLNIYTPLHLNEPPFFIIFFVLLLQ